MPVHVAAMRNYISKEQDKFYIAQADKKKKEEAAIKEIKCWDCLRVLELDDFSDKQKRRLPALVRQHGKEHLAGTGYLTCKMCGPQQIVEQQCARCDEYKSLDEFSKSQRKYHEDAVCIACSNERQGIEPVQATMKRLDLTIEEMNEEWGTPELVASISSSATAVSTPSTTSDSPSPLAVKKSKFWGSKPVGTTNRSRIPPKAYSTSASSTVVGDDWSGGWGTSSNTDQTLPEPSTPSSPAVSTVDLPAPSRQSAPSTSPLNTDEWTQVTTKKMAERRGQNYSYSRGRGWGQKGGNSSRGGGRGGAWS